MAMTKPHYQAEKEEIIKDGDNYRIKPRGLNIVWGNDERYWKIPAKGSRTEDPAELVQDPAELVQVSWLEVTGSVVELRPGKRYDLTFEVGLAGDAFGWKDIQVFLMAKVGKKGRYKWTRVKLDQDRNNEMRVTIPDNQKLSIDVPDTGDTTLHFGLYEVWSGKWKGGLKIYNATVTASA